MATRRFDRAGVLFGIGFPIVVAALGLVGTAIWIDRLPDPMATHWSGGAQPDGFAAPWANAAMMVGIIVIVGGGLGVVAAFARVQLMMRRMLLIASSLVTALIGTVALVLMASQLDLVDASQARLHGWTVPLGTVLGVAVGVGGAALLRDHRSRVAATGRPAADLPRAARLRLPLTESVGLSAGVAIALYGVLLIAAIVVGVLASTWWVVPVFAAVVLLTVTLTRFTVIVDDDGIRVRCAGATMMSYGADEIAAARVRDINPLTDFGGWGLRMRPKRTYGVVTRRGPAVSVDAACGDTLVITTERATELAGALNSLADRRSIDT